MPSYLLWIPTHCLYKARLHGNDGHRVIELNIRPAAGPATGGTSDTSLFSYIIHPFFGLEVGNVLISYVINIAVFQYMFKKNVIANLSK